MGGLHLTYLCTIGIVPRKRRLRNVSALSGGSCYCCCVMIYYRITKEYHEDDKERKGGAVVDALAHISLLINKEW
jgi:hypothetical protein